MNGGETLVLDDSRRARLRICVRGIVQGVGFRPCVFRLASKLRLGGWVLNDSHGLTVEVEGTGRSVRRFLWELPRQAPPLAVIDELQMELMPPTGARAFVIRHSQEQEEGYVPIAPDVATCPDCLRELFDPTDRRYHYPFINCTNCGPRLTIVEDVPYDRPRTTMKSFALCAECRAEYEDPRDRRFHAQPNACPVCGPRLWLRPTPQHDVELPTGSTGVSSAHPPGLLIAGRAAHTFLRARRPRSQVDQPRAAQIEGDAAIVEAQRLLAEGWILAIKGLGGFHLACDALNAAAVATLRARKRRAGKPFALMVRDLVAARGLCVVGAEEARLLTSPQRPIVLLTARRGSGVAPEVAPGQRRLGVMLAYTPLHHLLLEPSQGIALRALVMTSGNLTDEPIAIENQEALERLGGMADYFLLHDREIGVRCDDSVALMLDGAPTLVRRARGYAPFPVRLPFDLTPTLACGAELKNAFCLTRGPHAFLSQHIGDLENAETLSAFEETVERYRTLFHLTPRVVAHDMHPDYLSTRYALQLAERNPSLRLVSVQHHHAHLAACMAENGLEGRVIGVIWDGAGYGPDETVWGGEFLVGDYLAFQRVGHLARVPLPGGDAAARHPWRMALSYLRHALGDGYLDAAAEVLGRLDFGEVRLVARLLETGLNSPPTSSAGRLFDAVAALLGVRDVISYEGQAAMELEARARRNVADRYPVAVRSDGGTLIVDVAPALREMIGERGRRVPPAVMAARFHNALSHAIGETCAAIREQTGLERVCLSGGVFQNQLLVEGALRALRERGFAVYLHRRVPPNDGGLALGQALVADACVKAEGWNGCA